LTADNNASRLQLSWPGAGARLRQAANGRWVRDRDDAAHLRGLDGLRAWKPEEYEASCIVIRGQRLEALGAIRRLFARAIKLAYFDLPRLEIDDEKSAFRGDSERRYADWLTVVSQHLTAAARLLAEDGVVVLVAGDREEPFARLALHQVLGPHNYVGTLIWQRHYSARQVPNTRDIAAAHDLILIAARDKAALPPVGISVPPKGLKNPDYDPRGFWKGGHKGARKPDYPYGTRVPPYRWRITRGRLPEGVWRLNPQTGVLWSPSLVSAGTYTLTVECTDSANNISERTYTIEVRPEDPASAAYPVSWLWHEPKADGPLRITTPTLPPGIVGAAYSAMLEAQGGRPYVGERWPGEGRYQEHPKSTLEAAVREDRAVFGRKGDSIPWIKKYGDPEKVRPENVYSIWLGREPNGAFSDGGAGWTQDGTKHLEQLRRAGKIHRSVTTGKPETLMARVLALFTKPGDYALEVFAPSADMSAVAMKMGRSSVFLGGASSEDQLLLDECSIPRLRAVAAHGDTHEDEGDPDELADGAYAPCVATRVERMAVLESAVGHSLASLQPDDHFPELVAPAAFNCYAFLLSQGYIPLSETEGRSLDGRRLAILVPSREFLTEAKISDAVSQYGTAAAITIFYFRAIDLPENVAHDRLRIVRVPFDLDFRGYSL
jgi:hypothetical protein